MIYMSQSIRREAKVRGSSLGSFCFRIISGLLPPEFSNAHPKCSSINALQIRTVRTKLQWCVVLAQSDGSRREDKRVTNWAMVAVRAWEKVRAAGTV